MKSQIRWPGLVFLVCGLAACPSGSDKVPGSSATIEGVSYTVSPRIAGRILKIHVDEGDAVKAGQLLVELECEEPQAALAEAQAVLAASLARKGQATAQQGVAEKGVDIASRQTVAAGANVSATRSQVSVITEQIQNAERMVARIEQLRAKGGGTAKQLDDAKTQVAVLTQQRDAVEATTRAAQAQRNVSAGGVLSAQGQVAVAEAGLSLADADIARSNAAVSRATWYKDGCQIVATQPGTVNMRAFEPGEYVGPGTRILRIVNIETVEATFYLGNRDLELAKPGVAVEMVPDSMENQVFHGVIKSVSEVAEFTPRTVQTSDDRERLVYAVKVEVPNADKKLHPGMPVEVRIATAGKAAHE
jgi:HlyD family secretion protein